MIIRKHYMLSEPEKDTAAKKVKNGYEVKIMNAKSPKQKPKTSGKKIDKL